VTGSWDDHPAVRTGGDLTPGERIADKVVGVMGSWPFIIWQTFVVAGWVGLNICAWVRHFDPFPFILLNLAFSTQAAYAAPLILIASNRGDKKASELAQHTYDIDCATHELLQRIATKLEVDQ
jgi:uncharacterized membrane protein